MRVLVISDTHGNLKNALAVMDQEKFDLVLHAGDTLNDARRLASIAGVTLCGVTGNCDLPGSGPEEEFLSLEGNKILLTHGHQFGVKGSLQKIYYHALEREAGIVVFGHTHVPVNITERGVMLFNPGSISRPLPNSRPSYGMLEIDNGRLKGYIAYI